MGATGGDDGERAKPTIDELIARLQAEVNATQAEAKRLRAEADRRQAAYDLDRRVALWRQGGGWLQ